MSRPTHGQATLEVHEDDAATWSRTGERPTAYPSGMHSIALEPLTEAEMRGLRKAGREVRAFEKLAIEIMRTQMTLAVMPPRDDPEALRGLRRKERTLLLEALSLGTEGHEELRLAAALTRCVADDGDNLIAMLAAALEIDCMRLQLAGRRGRAEIPDA